MIVLWLLVRPERSEKRVTNMAEGLMTFETSIPQDIYTTLRTQGIFREALAERTQHLLAIGFFQERLLSLGQAARLAGLNRWQFIELLGEHDVPVLAFGDEELADEFAAVEQLAYQLGNAQSQ